MTGFSFVIITSWSELSFMFALFLQFDFSIQSQWFWNIGTSYYFYTKKVCLILSLISTRRENFKFPYGFYLLYLDYFQKIFMLHAIYCLALVCQGLIIVGSNWSLISYLPTLGCYQWNILFFSDRIGSCKSHLPWYIYIWAKLQRIPLSVSVYTKN